MLDLKFIRREPDAVRAAAAKKHVACDVDAILRLDGELRERGQRIDGLRGEQNRTGKQVASATPEERQDLVGRLTELKKELSELEATHKDQQAELDRLLLTVPNIPADEVPDGVDDTDNVELRVVGEPPSFDFEPRDHVDLATEQGWLHIERGARLAGSRNYVLMGDLALLEAAVMRWALDLMVAKGFTALSVPTLVRTEIMVGTGYFPGGEDQAYRCDERDDLVPGGHGRGAGHRAAPGRDPRGGRAAPALRGPVHLLPPRGRHLRQGHPRPLPRAPVPEGGAGGGRRGRRRAQPRAPPRRSCENSEQILQAFDLPYRVVNVCGGDLGAPQVQKFDIETWMPSREGYGETHSASRFHDYQARRLEHALPRAQGRRGARCASATR